MSIGSVVNQHPAQSLLLADLKKNGLTSDVATQVESEIKSVFESQASSGARPSPTDVRAAIEAKLKQDVSSGSLTQDQADSVVKALDEFESQIRQSGGPSGSRGAGTQGGPDPSELFAKLDADGDGTVTEDEFVAGRPDDVGEDQARQLYQKIAEKSGADAASGLSQDQFASGLAAAAPAGGPSGGGGAPPAGSGGSGGSGGGSGGSSDDVVSVTTTTSPDGTRTTVTKYADGSSSTSVTYGQADSSTADALQSILKSLTKGDDNSTDTAAYLKRLLSGSLIDTRA